MGTAITALSDQKARQLAADYAAKLARSRTRWLVGAAVLAILLVLSAWGAEVRPSTFIDNIQNFTNYIVNILPTITVANFAGDLKAWFWNLPKWLGLLGETLLIAYLGTLTGAVGAFCLCFLASPTLTKSATVRFAAKRFLEFCRTVPEVVFALLFVIAFGLGPLVGVLALGIHTIGALGKLFSEVVDNVDRKPVEGLTATGAPWVAVLRYAVMPQVLAGFVSYTLLRFEINVRSAGVMGFVGAGGIGMEFLVAIRNFYYTDVSAILLLIIVTVSLIDVMTERMRHALIGLDRAP